MTTVGSTNAGSVQADGPAGTLGAVRFVVVAPSWLPPGPPLDGALEEGSTGARIADPDVDLDVDPEVFAAGRVVDRLTGLGQTLTRTHFLPRRRRTTLHFGFGFGFGFGFALA